MLAVLKKAGKYFSPQNKLYLKGYRYSISKDEWALIPDSDKELFETVDEELKEIENKTNKQKKNNVINNSKHSKRRR